MSFQGPCDLVQVSLLGTVQHLTLHPLLELSSSSSGLNRESSWVSGPGDKVWRFERPTQPGIPFKGCSPRIARESTFALGTFSFTAEEDISLGLEGDYRFAPETRDNSKPEHFKMP